MSAQISNHPTNRSLDKFFILNQVQPAVSFDLIYPYTALMLTDIVLTSKSSSKRNKGELLVDYYLRTTLKKTNGESRSFPVNLIKYIHTMRLLEGAEDIAFTLNLPIAQANNPSKPINSQEPYYHYAEIALEHNITSTNKPVELKIYYQDSDGLELNKV